MHILIVDDHTLFRRGLRLLLDRLYPNAKIEEAANADQAWQLVEEGGPFDFLLLDLSMPGIDGIERIRDFVIAQGDRPVIMLSARTEPDEIMQCMDAGVRGYIPKSVTENVLQNALSLAAAGEVFLPAAITKNLSSACGSPAIGSETFGQGNPLGLLTPRQRNILTLLIKGQSNKEIARNLDLRESTIKTHIKIILKKLNVQNRTQAALAATDLGWPRT